MKIFQRWQERVVYGIGIFYKTTEEGRGNGAIILVNEVASRFFTSADFGSKRIAMLGDRRDGERCGDICCTGEIGTKGAQGMIPCLVAV